MRTETAAPKRDIEFTEIVDESSKAKAGSALTRGAIGGMPAGSAGVFAGTLGAKTNDFTTFAIHWNNGRMTTEKVKNDSRRYRGLTRHLRQTRDL